MCVGCSPLIYVAMGGAPDDVDAIALATPIHGTTLGSHDDFDPRCAGDFRAPDAAYVLEVPRDGRYSVRARATFDVVLAVYEGEHLVACNDDHDERSIARLVVDLEASTRYLVVVDGWGGAEGDFVLAVDERPPADVAIGPTPPSGDGPPEEDEAALAARCTEAPLLAEGATEGVLIPTDAHAVTRCGAGGRGPEAIYRLELEGPARVEMEVRSESVDAIVELRRGCSGDDAEVVACVDDAPDQHHTALAADLDAGSYVLLVDSYAPDAGGAFVLETTITPREEEPATEPAEPETTR
jgi:hypothetical protein